MNQRLDRDRERRYVLPSAGVVHRWSNKILFLLALAIGISGLAIGFSLGYFTGVPKIPRCEFAPDVIIGSGEYNRDIGYWSEYECVSELAFTDHNYVSRKSGIQP